MAKDPNKPQHYGAVPPAELVEGINMPWYVFTYADGGKFQCRCMDHLSAIAIAEAAYELHTGTSCAVVSFHMFWQSMFGNVPQMIFLIADPSKQGNARFEVIVNENFHKEEWDVDLEACGISQKS